MEILSRKEENKIRNFVKKSVRDADIAHGFEHIEAVVKFAKLIGKDEKANLRIAVTAAYLHDLVHRDKAKSFDTHTEKSAEEAGKFLEKIGFSDAEIKSVKNVIMESSYEHSVRGIKTTSKEAEVVRDADWLDSIGARGIARVFGFSGYYKKKEMGKVKWNPEKPAKFKRNLKGTEYPIYHFFSKLLWMKGSIQTRLGKKIAEERHRYIVDFLKRYKAESEGLK